MAEGTEKATYPPERFTAKNGVSDGFSDVRNELDSPATHAIAITPSQETLPTAIRGLYIGSSGNVFCRVLGGNTTHQKSNIFFRNVVSGTILPVRMDGVWNYNSSESDLAEESRFSQNTTATFLVGLY